MVATTLKPITRAQLVELLKKFSYQLVYDRTPVMQFEKDGSLPLGYEQAARYWQKVLTIRYPDYHSDKHNELVYDQSEAIDIIKEIMSKSNPSTDRTTVGFEIRAILKPKEVLVDCMRSLLELRAVLEGLEPGKTAEVPYSVYEALFPPGEPDQTARDRASSLARECGCVISTKVALKVVCFAKSAA
jgi:hypothetical protein